MPRLGRAGDGTRPETSCVVFFSVVLPASTSYGLRVGNSPHGSAFISGKSPRVSLPAKEVTIVLTPPAIEAGNMKDWEHVELQGP